MTVVVRPLSCKHTATFVQADERDKPPVGLPLPERWFCQLCRKTVEVR